MADRPWPTLIADGRSPVADRIQPKRAPSFLACPWQMRSRRTVFAAAVLLHVWCREIVRRSNVLRSIVRADPDDARKIVRGPDDRGRGDTPHLVPASSPEGACMRWPPKTPKGSS